MGKGAGSVGHSVVSFSRLYVEVPFMSVHGACVEIKYMGRNVWKVLASGMV